jgi:hypothetical protein
MFAQLFLGQEHYELVHVVVVQAPVARLLSDELSESEEQYEPFRNNQFLPVFVLDVQVELHE